MLKGGGGRGVRGLFVDGKGAAKAARGLAPVPPGLWLHSQTLRAATGVAQGAGAKLWAHCTRSHALKSRGACSMHAPKSAIDAKHTRAAPEKFGVAARLLASRVEKSRLRSIDWPAAFANRKGANSQTPPLTQKPHPLTFNLPTAGRRRAAVADTLNGHAAMATPSSATHTTTTDDDPAGPAAPAPAPAPSLTMSGKDNSEALLQDPVAFWDNIWVEVRGAGVAGPACLRLGTGERRST